MGLIAPHFLLIFHFAEFPNQISSIFLLAFDSNIGLSFSLHLFNIHSGSSTSPPTILFESSDRKDFKN
jgi:hypothetical protein